MQTFFSKAIACIAPLVLLQFTWKFTLIFLKKVNCNQVLSFPHNLNLLSSTTLLSDDPQNFATVKDLYSSRMLETI